MEMEMEMELENGNGKIVILAPSFGPAPPTQATLQDYR